MEKKDDCKVCFGPFTEENPQMETYCCGVNYYCTDCINKTLYEGGGKCPHCNVPSRTVLFEKKPWRKAQRKWKKLRKKLREIAVNPEEQAQNAQNLVSLSRDLLENQDLLTAEFQPERNVMIIQELRAQNRELRRQVEEKNERAIANNNYYRQQEREIERYKGIHLHFQKYASAVTLGICAYYLFSAMADMYEFDRKNKQTVDMFLVIFFFILSGLCRCAD